MFRTPSTKTLFAKTLLITLALARRDHRTGEGEGGDDGKLTEQQWEDKKRAELGKRSMDQLVSKQIDLERDLKKARDRATPEGSRVLTADEAKEFEALSALGSSKDVKTRLESGDAATVKLTGRERGDMIRDVSEAAGYKASVLGRLADQDKLSFELGAEVEKDGKKSRPVTVKTADGKTAALDEYAKSNWGEFEASLTATGGQQQQTQDRRVVTGGASNQGNTKTQTPDDALNSKRADSRYSI
ncbi:hypothetical protein ACI3L1_06675 [Deinococcus sp. SM5_A1]|uniref:hypothetical protein n=1 Tax=Deinococcus sp. SM5_A1 TaxID=3379094 RepID=UPI00385FBB18